MNRSTYLEILLSTLLIGGSTAVNVAIGIARTKAMAVLLGPASFGLMSVYTSLVDLTRSVAEMGISKSGVRQIAESVHSGDAGRVARTVVVLRRTTAVLGIVGALVLMSFARPIAATTFGSEAHAPAIALLSVAVFLQVVGGGQSALLQGMRRVSDLARIGVWGSLLGTLASIPIVYYRGADGIVPALVVVAALSAGTSWWYSRKVDIGPCTMSSAVVRNEAASLLKLGMAFMASGLLTMSAAYVVRLFVVRQSGLEAAGLYQAAWVLGGLYVGFILQAMGADFYPRLVGAAGDHQETNRLVNEQAQVSLLLAGPGVIATLTFAPLIVTAFYSVQFAAAVEVLRWICLGMALRVISWPMGYIIVARNRQWLFFAAELAWTVVNVGLSWTCVQTFGLVGAGIAFFGSYAFHAVMIYAMVRHLSDFRWSSANRRMGLYFIVSVGFVFCTSYLLSAAWAVGIGVVAVVISSARTAHLLLKLLPVEQLPRKVRLVLQGIGATVARYR